MKKKDLMWSEKYRPTTLENYVFYDDHQKSAILQMIKSQTIPNMLFSGIQGTGKTTLVRILLRELGMEGSYNILTVNASDEARTEDIRDRIKSFINTCSLDSEYKIVVLEEADYLHHTGQAIFRVMIENAENVRFILTCNYENRILPAMKSRLQHFRFKKHDVDLVTILAVKILRAEKVKFDLDLLDKYVAVGYPDIRKIINLLQQNVVDGVLLPITSPSESGDYKFTLLDYLEDKNWFEARKLVCSEVTSDQWEELFHFVYENVDKIKSLDSQSKQEQAIVIIADHLYRHSLVADPEINVAAMFIRLSQL